MKHIEKNTKPVVILALVCLLFAGCKTQELEDFSLVRGEPATVAAGDVSGSITKNNEFVTLPIKVTLSRPASKAFQVGVRLHPDTIQQLIENNTLENVAAIPSELLVLPNVVQVPYGADSAWFEISANRSFLERHYGEDVVFAVKLVDPGKGNQLDATHSTSIIRLNTSNLLEPDDIRYLTITNGGGEILEARNRQNYTSTSAGLTIPLGVTLTGVPSRPFSVRAQANLDTIATLVAQGVLPENTVALGSGDFSMNQTIHVGSNMRSANFEVSIPWHVVENHVEEGDLLAVHVSLYDPSLHQTHSERHEVIILIHPEFVVEVDVTADGRLSVSRDNNGGPEHGEGSPKIVDNNINTKFLQSSFSGDLWIRLDFDEPVVVGAYTMTSANDAPDRDPKSWNLQGSLDGITWTTLDTRTDEAFPQRFQTRRFDFNNSTPYAHYRLNITANNGGSLFQQAEWRLIRVP